MYEYKDAEGLRGTIRSDKTLIEMARTGVISENTPFKRAGESGFVLAGQHSATAAIIDTHRPGPVGILVAAERKRRDQVLAHAVEAMAPVISLLRERKREGGDIGFTLRPPSAFGSSEVLGYLRCASLGGGSKNEPEDYDLNISPDGRITVTIPDSGDADCDDDNRDRRSVSYTSDKLAEAIRDAEVAHAMQDWSPKNFSI